LAAAFSAQTYAVSVHASTNHLYDNKPYSTHLKMVVDYAIKYLHLMPKSKHLITLQAAWLHDTIEDCRVTYNDLKNEFSQEVAEVVFALSNEKGRTRKERANDKYYLGIQTTPCATFVKICDRLANVKYSKITGSRMLEVYKNEFEYFNNKLWSQRFTPMFDEMYAMFV
jgi:(p)ppGpp synthase/HD superfamily hydrolase